MTLYSYEGTLSEISSADRDIVLCNVWNDTQPPVKLRANAGIHKYLMARSWTDDEERYIKSKWVYDRCLLLQFIEIPSTRRGWPAKIIAVADPSRVSMDVVVFGPHALIQTDHPEPMCREEYLRWDAFRQQHNLYNIH